MTATRMLSDMRLWSACSLAFLLAACSGRRFSDPDAGTDGSTLDATIDATAPDGGTAPRDAGRDAGPSDAGSDAGPSGCVCPALPVACTAPAADQPAFTPDATEVATQLFDVIACADSTLQIAIYEAEWGCIQGALQAALDADPDLTIELVVDNRQCAVGSCFADLLTPSERVTVVRDMRSGLMHHKYAIADGTRLWVGSTNFTERSFCRDLNNAIVIEEADIVARYAAVFDRMFRLEEFGPVAPEGGTAAGLYTVYFSPESPSSTPPAWMNAMVAAIDAATASVDLMVFAWTRTEISDALVAAHARGVTVRGLVAGSYADDAPAQALLVAGVDIRVASVHSKVMIIDGETVITGSANWSENAWSNNESSLWIHDTATANAYLADFEPVYAEASAVAPAP